MRHALLMASGLLASVSVSWICSISAAHAQGYANQRPAVDTSHLQPTQFFRYRPIVSIEDDSPIVNDHRHPVHRKKLLIAVPPMEEVAEDAMPAGATHAGGNVYVMPGSGGSSNNPMLGDRFLDDAGPRSYVHHQPVTAGRDLPSGVSTGVHANVQAPSAVAPHGAGNGRFTAPRSASGAAPMVETAMYRDGAGSIGGSTTTRVRTNTAAKLLGKIK